MSEKQRRLEEERLRKLMAEQSESVGNPVDSDDESGPSFLDEEFQVSQIEPTKTFVSSIDNEDKEVSKAPAYQDPFESLSQSEPVDSKQSSEDLENNLKARVAHLPAGNKSDIQSVHEDMVLAEREFNNSEGYIASAGENRADYQKRLKEQFNGLNGQDFKALPKPNEVEFGDQAQAREYSDYYDLRGYGHHKTVSYYTNDEDRKMRLEAANSHMDSFKGRLESDARHASLTRHIDRQCQNLGIDENQKEEMKVEAEKDFEMSGGISTNRGILSAKEENDYGITRDESELHKMRAQREDMLRNDQSHTDEYKDLMDRIEEQREEIGLDPVKTQEEALEELLEEEMAEDQERETEMQQLEEAEQDLTEEKLLDDEMLQEEERQYEPEQVIEMEEEEELSNIEASDEIEKSQNEDVTIEKFKTQDEDLSYDDQQRARIEDIQKERASFDSFAMGGGDESLVIDESEQMESDLELDNFDDWGLEDELDDEIEAEVDLEQVPEVEESLVQEEELETEEDRELDAEIRQMASDHLDSEQSQEAEMDAEPEFEVEVEAELESEAESELEAEVEPELESENLDEAYAAIMDSDEALEFEQNDGPTDEETMEMDELMSDIEDQQEDRELGVDMDEEQDKKNEFSM